MDGNALARMEDSRRLGAGERPTALPSMRRTDVHRLPANEIQLVDASVVGTLPRYRIYVGDLIVDLRHASRHLTTELHVPRGRAVLLVPLNGTITIAHGQESIACRAGIPWLGAAPCPFTLSWQDCSGALAVYFRAEQLNAAVSAVTGDGRRLASVAMALAPIGETRGLLRATELMTGLVGTSYPDVGAATVALAASFYQGLAQHLCDDGRWEIMQPVRAVSDAMRLIRAKHQSAFDLEGLAAAVGVTGGTLRKNFRACLGMTVKEHIRLVRLAWAYQRLESGMECRSIAELAVAAGFADTPSFSRAYLRRYSESASQTRARAVQQRE